MDWPCTDDPDDFGTCSECTHDPPLSPEGECPDCGLSFVVPDP